MPSYKVLRPVIHNGQRHESGVLTLPGDAAMDLIASGHLAEPDADHDADYSDAGLSERELALRAALAELDATDPERTDRAAWSRTGRPKLAAVRRHPELADVTADELAAAWDALQGGMS